MLFKSPRGTKDILPQESSKWQTIESKARKIFSLFGFEEIRTPLIEDAKLFARSLGDFTDIVQKQMFLIKRETDTFVLRPEATASIVRAYVEHDLYNISNVCKFYYMGPMFRAERPQKGRLRQFHHFGAEAIGSANPFLDAELIYLATRIIFELGLSDFEVVVNTLGCQSDKKKMSVNLKEKLMPHKKSLCEDCVSRIDKNVFRVLDCKNPQCKDIIMSLSWAQAHICEDCHKHFESVLAALDTLGVRYKIDPLLVRGLDYYTRTVFEISSKELGAQDALGAGGRYDNLVEELGGPSRGSIGFALGVERLLLALSAKTEEASKTLLDCYIIPLGEAALKKSLSVLNDLRMSGVPSDLDYLDGSLKARLRRADKKNAKFCLIIGDNELAKCTGILKNMSQSTQEEVLLAELVNKIKAKV
jgi:histidyl-tRNA synthetase